MSVDVTIYSYDKAPIPYAPIYVMPEIREAPLKCKES